VDTLDGLRAIMPGGRDQLPVVIISAEAAAGLETWHEPDRLLELCRLAIVPRRGYPPPDRAWLDRRFPGKRDRFIQLDGPDLGRFEDAFRDSVEILARDIEMKDWSQRDWWDEKGCTRPPGDGPLLGPGKQRGELVLEKLQYITKDPMSGATERARTSEVFGPRLEHRARLDDRAPHSPASPRAVTFGPTLLVERPEHVGHLGDRDAGPRRDRVKLMPPRWFAEEDLRDNHLRTGPRERRCPATRKGGCLEERQSRRNDEPYVPELVYPVDTALSQLLDCPGGQGWGRNDEMTSGRPSELPESTFHVARPALGQPYDIELQGLTSYQVYFDP